MNDRAAEEELEACRDELDLYRGELDRLRHAALELRTGYHARERELDRARRQLREVKERERRLREHPTVRALLAGRRLTAPVRARLGGGRETSPWPPPSESPDTGTPAGDRKGLGWRPPPHEAGPAPHPAAYRERLSTRIRGGGDRPLRVAVAGDAAGALADGFAAFGWHVSRLEPLRDGGVWPAGIDAAVLSDPSLDAHSLPGQPVQVGVASSALDAWLAAPWFDDLDVVLVEREHDAQRVRARSAKTATVTAGVDLAEAVREALASWCAATRVSLAVATPSRQVAEWWGDTHFGRALQRQLERHGHPTRVYLREDYASPDLVRSDICLHLWGLAVPRPQPGQVNVLWVISHPERLDRKRTERYDLILTASEPFAARLTPMVDAPVVPLPQATDPERFRPEPTGPAHDLLFVGNSRRTRRRIIDDLTPTHYDLAVYGGDWTADLLDPRYLRGEVVPNAELHRYYAAAKIVLNDHWPEMAQLGFISNRIYDALAAGAMVISDEVEGLGRALDGAVLTYRGREELRALVDRYLHDEAGRRELAERGRRAVLERHTFAHRAERLLELVQPFLDARRKATGAR